MSCPNYTAMCWQRRGLFLGMEGSIKERGWRVLEERDQEKSRRGGGKSIERAAIAYCMYSMAGLPQAQRPGERTLSCLLLQRDPGRGDQHRKGYLGPKPHWVVEVVAREGPGGLALGPALSLGATPRCSQVALSITHEFSHLPREGKGCWPCGQEVPPG